MRLFALCLAVTFAAPAFAQQGKDARPTKPRTQVVDMSDEQEVLTADLSTPAGEPITVRHAAEFESLIRVRNDFNERVLRSFSDL